MITTSDHRLADTARLLRNQGMRSKYANELVGFNTRMTDIAAAIGRVQLRRLPEWTRLRRANASFLDGRLKTVNTPWVSGAAHHVYHQYTVRSDDRNSLEARLNAEGVGCAVYYPTPVHRLPSFAGGPADLPVTDELARTVLSLPVHPGLSPSDLESIALAVDHE